MHLGLPRLGSKFAVELKVILALVSHPCSTWHVSKGDVIRRHM